MVSTARVDLKVGFACNNHCVFCAQGDKRSRCDALSTEELVRRLAQGRSKARGLVLTGGQVTSFTDSGANNLPRPAYGGLVVNNQMMAFGGFQAGAATTASVTAQMNTANTLSNFNSLGGGVLLQPRALQGTTIESAFIYQLGGANAGVNTAQNTTEQTIW